MTLTQSGTALGAAIDEVAAGAVARDTDLSGAFPESAISALEAAGALARSAAGGGLAYTEQLALLRRVAGADGGVARILDGHLNAVERLRVHAEPDLARSELDAIARGTLRAGVWGADPGPGEGMPAKLDGAVISGTKTFCSGAGGLERALVLVADADAGPPSAAWVDLTKPGTVEVDRSWFAGAGMRSSASHRVLFDRAPVLAIFGEPGALALQPWFARDAVRTAATWAGMADAVLGDALDRLRERSAATQLEGLAAARMLRAQRAADLWLRSAAERLAGDTSDAGPTAAFARSAIAEAARAIVDEADRVLGSHPLATGSAIDRAGRDLRLFLLQHRLDPILARTGLQAIEDAT